jgi:hypothetical protein
MQLTYLSQTFFPFKVPAKDASFASQVGARTVYPAGYSLDQALQIYWRAQHFRLVATGNGTEGDVTQALGVNDLLPPRNAEVGTGFYLPVTSQSSAAPGDLVTGQGLRQVMPGTGTITASGDAGSGTNPDALFNLQVDLFFAGIFVPDPVVNFNDLWWPAMSISCLVENTVMLDEDDSLGIQFDCTTLPDPHSTTNIGSFSFFGVSVPVFCTALGLEVTRSFSGALTVADEWP